MAEIFGNQLTLNISQFGSDYWQILTLNVVLLRFVCLHLLDLAAVLAIIRKIVVVESEVAHWHPLFQL